MSRTALERRLKESGLTPEQIFARETQGIIALSHSGTPDLSELPIAYKDADRVQAEMARFGLADVVDRVQPVGCIMAGVQPRAPWQIKAMEKRAAREAEAARLAAETDVEPEDARPGF